MSQFCFVGERQSPKAAQIGATWQNGKLSAKNLHEALKANNIEPENCVFLNLWVTPGLGKIDEKRDLSAEKKAARQIRNYQREGFVIVALGSLVSKALSKHHITHLKMVHPAARGRIRKTELYRAHVGQVLALKAGDAS